MILKRVGKIDFVELPSPDNSLSFFKKLKSVTEEYWADTEINNKIYGFQIQRYSIWNPGLTDLELSEFERDMGFEFPEPLKNFYKVMNGISKPGINVFGNSGKPSTFQPVFYSYPHDIHQINELINWIYEANSINKNDLKNLAISRIFPVYLHRFMLIDIPDNPILSMYFDDVIYWADSLSKLLGNEIFSNIYNIYDFENKKNHEFDINFWLDYE